MNIRPMEFTIDLKNCNLVDLKMQQGYNYTLKVNVLDNNIPAILDNASAYLHLIKADDTYLIQTKDISVENNIININLDNDFTRAYGQAKLQIFITENNTITGSWVLNVTIEKGALQEESISLNRVDTIEELNLKIAEAVQRINEINNLIAVNDLVKKAELLPINEAINTKVTKVTGKQLSTNDFTNADKENVDKVPLLESNINSNVESINTNIQDINISLANKMNSTKGSSTDKFNDIYVGDSLMAESGYNKATNGFIEQWGVVTGVTNTWKSVTFSIPFPNKCTNVMLMELSETGGSQQVFVRDTITTTRFEFKHESTTQRKFMWRAIGY